MASKPTIEFVGQGRSPFEVQGAIAVIGRNPTCAIVIDGPGVEERHARLSVDAQGDVSIEDLGSQQGTWRNNAPIVGKVKLTDGDALRVGTINLQFRAGAPVVAQDISLKTSNTDKTMMPGELPPEVKALLARREAELAAQKAAGTAPAPKPAPAPAPAREPQSLSVPANIVVGKPEVAPQDEGRTMVAQEVPEAVKELLAKAAAQQAAMQAPQPSGDPRANQTVAMQAPVLSPQAQQAGRSTILGMPPMAAPTPTPTPEPAHAAPQPYSQPAAQAPEPAPYTPPAAAEPAPYTAPAQAAPGVASPAQPSPFNSPYSQPQPNNQPYTPPAKKGAFGSFSRAFAFFGQMRDLAKQAPVLKKPLMLNILIASIVMVAVSVPLIFVNSYGMFYGFMTLGTVILYFIDYFCNALTASLIYDHVTTGNATMEAAKARVKSNIGPIAIFGAVSGVLDVASTYARERGDIVAKIILNIIRAIWTTATYVMMPAIVIEKISFGDALKRSKDLMKQDPTGVGAGVVAVSIVCYIVGFLVFAIGGTLMRIGFSIWMPLGVILWLLTVNTYWAVTGWLKISYSTCFYLWAKECERTGSQDSSLAPLPLRSALDSA